MRYVRYAFLATIGICLISLSLANRGLVTLQLFPDGIVQLFGWNASITLPLFIVVLGGIAAGLIIGFFWEWMREYKIRRDASRATRDLRQLERQVNRLKTEKHAGKDEVLALLDEAS